MKIVSILVPENAVMAAIADPRYMFTAVNGFLENAGKPPIFKIQLVSLHKEVKLHEGVFTIKSDHLLEEVHKTDLIIIPALSGDMKTAIKLNEAYIPWITKHYEKGAEVASLCIGAFLLAATGLLEGKTCSTHWLYANQFRSMYPDIELVDDKIITEQNRIYTSGGASSYWNLLLYLVEKFIDRETAILASKFFVLDIDRNSQSPFTIFKGQKEHEDEVIKKCQEYIEQNYNDKITIEQLSEMFVVGRRSFERRFKKATNNSVMEYIQRVKIEAAKKSMEISRKNINEVMYEVGYIDPKAFRDVFKKIAGMTPMEYRNKYNKVAIVR